LDSKKTGPARVPDPHPPKKRRSAASRVFLGFFLLLLFGVVAGGIAGFIGYQEYNLPGPLAGKKVFIIEKGLGTPEIAAKLEDAGIISNARVFSAMAFVTGARGRLKAGEYEFPAAASMQDVANLIMSGKSIVYKLTIPEGWTTEMALARVRDNPVLTGDIADPPAEGAIMPDTYVFKRGTTRQQLVESMKSAQAKLLEEIWLKRSPLVPFRSKEEALILASIVEKETGTSEERPLVASVFVNRLKQGMRLQSDPTIIYGIVGGKGKLDRPLTKTDIAAPTPYNTYTIDGLPPGPISNPGRDALEAVANPPDTGYLYFVADGTGGHAFAKSLEEHNRNVAKWRAIEGAAAAVSAQAMSEDPVEATATAGASAGGEAQVESPSLTGVVEEPAVRPGDQNALTPETTATGGQTGNGAETAGSGNQTAEVPETAGVSENPQTGEAAKPADSSPADQTATAESPTAKPGPTAKPRQKPVRSQTAQTSDGGDQTAVAASPASDPKPGTIIKVGNRLVAIPRQKPKR